MSDNFPEAKRFVDEGEQRRVLVDIDETICFYGETRRYDLAVPNHEMIAKINKLYDESWYVHYWTARGGVSGVEYYNFTMNQLKSWGCKFHELSTGTTGSCVKPIFDLLIDDKSKRIEEL
jgi:hypothetical protein